MGCRIERSTDGSVVAIICTRGARTAREKQCVVCYRYESRTTMKLCDFPLRGEKQGQACDRPVCVDHAMHVEPDTDYCPAHARLIKASAV